MSLRPLVSLAAAIVALSIPPKALASELGWLSPEGCARVQMVLDAAGNGSIKFGDSELPEPDPTRGPLGRESASLELGPIAEPAVEAGFAFSVHEADVAERRIRFSFERYEMFQRYCELHKAVKWDVAYGIGDEYRCYGPSPVETSCHVWPTTGTTPDAASSTLPIVPVDCQALLFCTSAHCACDASGCRAQASKPQPAIDAALEDNGRRLVGTLVLRDQRITVRLERQ